MWTNQRTRQGDTLVSLARAYGVPVAKILSANSIRTPQEHTDRYLSTRAQECMIPANLPRKTLSKLVLECDIQRWANNVGGECTPLRVGSKTDVMRLLACAPGEFCHFSSESIINLPQRKRIAGLAGLGAVASSDVAVLVRDIPVKAKVMADAVVGTFQTQAQKAWRETFLEQVQQLTTVALKKRPDGRFNFEADKTFVARIMSFVEKEVAEAEQEFSFTASVRRVVDDNVRAVRAAVAAASAAATAVLDSISPDAKTKKDNSALASVRAAANTLKKGAKGSAVTELQTMLRQVGLSVGVDGDFGNNTKGGVEDFQKFRNLPVDGVLDAATLRDLDAVVDAGGKVTSTRRSGGGARKAAAPAQVQPAAVQPPPPVTPPPAQASNTLKYAAAAFGAVLVVGGLALSRR